MTSSTANQVAAPRIPWWIVVLAVGLTFLFFAGLWLGEGLIGGDLYTYSLPQKAFLADSLRLGTFPLWNPLVGQGYPVLAESQTGTFYPLHWLYGCLSITTANNVVLIVHYTLAFLAMFWCSRWLGRQMNGATLAAVVYVYGWFPARSSLDWAILGGVYLPLAIGCFEAWWQTMRPRYAVGLSLAIGLQLLGGHFHLAFLTWLLLGGYGLWRWSTSCQAQSSSAARIQPVYCRREFVALVAFVLGVGSAGVQLIPTWELKSRSQRAEIDGREFDPAYGHLPPVYLSQVALPWVWYDSSLDLDAALAKLTYLAYPSLTNRVEAHLYFGQIPFYLSLAALVIGLRRAPRDKETVFWLVVIVGSLWYATGWLLPWVQSVPGFNFFRGPGRGGLLTTFAVAILSARMLDRWTAADRGRMGSRLATVAIVLTIVDVWYWPSNISYALSIPNPPINFRAESLVRRILQEEPTSVRLFAPGANLPTLTGVSALPVYLGLGPEEYFADPIPPVDPDDFHTYSAERVGWLRRAGVTHVLSLEPLEPRGWPVDLLWSGRDPLLNRAWGRYQEPIFLYRLQHATGRVVWESQESAGPAEIVESGPHRVRIVAETEAGGTLVLRDLNYPGWVVSVDGRPERAAAAGKFRGVELSAGRHEVIWSYRPASVYWGAGMSGLAVIGLGLGWWTLSRRRDCDETVSTRSAGE